MTATITCAGCKHGYAPTALFCPNCGRAKARDQVSDALIGKILGERFQVQELLGQGGSGTIYRAEHVTLRRRVAIKVLHTELSRDDLAVERFRREATTVADIDNEHIVEIHDFGRTPDGRLYLAMELLEGETLDHVLEREKTLSVERVADVLIQVGEALMEAHAIGYVHRDLRPRNVYLAVRRGKANFVKLLDFGLAKLVETDSQAASTSLGMTFGDPRYMSPEQARGDRIDRRADIYQLGCVAYEMLTGAPPFAGNRVFEILTKQVTEAPQPLPSRRPGVPLWMEAAVAKMLAKDPENRFATTTRMVDALRRGLETGEVMDDDIARRRESVPPPSVSRVMQRMGLSSSDAHNALPVAVEPPAVTEPPRKRTGTPVVGLPVVTAPPPPLEDPTQRPVTGVIEAVRPSADPIENISQVWYEDPSDDDKRGRAASRTDVSFYDEAPPRRRGLYIGILAGFLVVGGTIAFALSHGGSQKPAEPPAPQIAALPPVDAAPSQIIAPEVTPDAAPVAVTPPPPTHPVVATAPHAPVHEPETRAPAHEPDAAELEARRPGSHPPAVVTPPVVTPPVVTPVTHEPPKPAVSGGPTDPYNEPPAPTVTPPASDGGAKAQFYANLGQQQLNGGDASNAAASFKKALELDPRSMAATMGMGDIALRQGLYGDAIVYLTKATKLDGKNSHAFSMLGDAYLSSGNHTQAAAQFKKALQLDPDNARAREGYDEASKHVPPPSDD